MAVTLTVELAGPSGKVQSKLLAAGVSVRSPLAPQDSVTVMRVVAGIADGVRVGLGLALVGAWSAPLRVTVGATLATDRTSLSSGAVVVGHRRR